MIRAPFTSVIAVALLAAACVAADRPEPTPAQSAAGASDAPFADEPEAHALYDGMTAALREARTLSYRGEFSLMRPGKSYRIWLAKPNQVRLEVRAAGGPSAVLVGDGETFWTYWPGGRPPFTREEQESFARQSRPDSSRLTCYMKKRVGVGMHSIAHDASDLGLGLLIVDPSTFHGYTDSMQEFLDAVRSHGVDVVDGEECDLIEVRFMNGQRRRYLWLARRDRLPRRLKEVIFVRDAIVITERWRDVVVNGDIPDDLFCWTPPEGWAQFVRPEPGARVLAAGAEAPDFDFPSMDGAGRVRLSDRRGEIVWLYVWRAG